MFAPAAPAAAPISPTPGMLDPAGPLLLFDALGPFFTGRDTGPDLETGPAGGASPRFDTGSIGPATPTPPTNWSKIPFAELELERDGGLDPVRIAAILTEFERYVARMAGLGYTALAIDDVAHLVIHPFYPEPLQRKLAAYRELYERIFALVAAQGLRLFVLTDYLFANPAIDAHLAATGQSEAAFFTRSVDAALAAYPQIAGIVLRIGESDGVDVAGDFTSRLAIRRPREARALLARLLPVCEARDATLVVRTWTLGAYPVGDLIWNPRTYDAVFGGLDSPNLIVSLKYGDADFFRYLALNPLVFHGPQRKLIEFQCRREYEGMGEYPSFVGWLYARYLEELRSRPNRVVGIFALQGGGWAPFAGLAYCGAGSFWNELNTDVTVKLFLAHGLRDERPDASTVEAIVEAFCRARGIADTAGFIHLLRLSEEAIERGLYVRAFAERPLYFRRVRVPPLIWVFWNNVTTGGLVGMLSRYRVRDKAGAVAEGHAAVDTVREMAALARQVGLPDDGIRFQLATFELLALLREVLLGLDTAETRTRLVRLATAYRRTYPAGYVVDWAEPCEAPRATSAVQTNRVRATPSVRQHRLGQIFALFVPLLVRDQTAYRRGDRIMLNRHVTRAKARVAARMQATLPRFVDKQGMTSDVLLR